MKWVEIITLRSAKDHVETIDTKLLFSIVRSHQNLTLKEVKVYRHATIETDLSVHLLWDSNSVDQMGSKLTQHLIKFLSEYGLINHSVWIEDAK